MINIIIHAWDVGGSFGFMKKSRIQKFHVGFDVFIAVVMKSIIFRDVTPCSLLCCNRRFGGTYRLHLQGRRKKFQQEPASKQVASRT
jgi:hypothetical protein